MEIRNRKEVFKERDAGRRTRDKRFELRTLFGHVAGLGEGKVLA